MKTLSISTFHITFFILLFCTSVFSQNSFATWEENYNNGINAINSKNYKDAISLLQHAYTFAKDTFEKNSEDLGINAYYLGFTYQKTSDFKNAVKYYLESLNIIESNQGKDSVDYINLTSRVSLMYQKLGKYENALKYRESANLAIKKNYGEKSKEYGKALSSLSQIYYYQGKYDLAIPIQNHVLSLYSDQDKKSIEYAIAIYTMSLLYSGITEYNKEIKLLNQFIEILGEDHKNTIDAYNNLSTAYSKLGDYENNLKTCLKVIKNTPENDQNYPTRLLNLAYAYGMLGEFNKSSEIFKKAIESCRSIYGSEHQKYIEIIDAFGQHNYNQKNFEAAKKLQEKALLIFLKVFDENHPKYGFYLNNYTNTLLALNQFDKAIELMKKNITISESNLETESESYYRKQLTLAQAYNKINEYNKALAILSIYTKKLRSKLGSLHPDYGNMLKTLGETYFGLGKVEKAIPIIDSSNQILISQIDKVFKFRSEKEKQAFLKTVNKTFDEIQSLAFKLNNPNNLLNDINLNNQIMLKGLLLNSSKSILTNLSSLGDTLINNKVQTYRSLKNNYSKTLSLPFEERILDIDSLNELINIKEGELVTIHNKRFDEENNFLSDWKTSQEKLRDDDLAIEFSHFELTSNNKLTDSIMYVAYLYKTNWESSIMLPLFEEKQLRNITQGTSPNQLYNSIDLFDLIWKPIEEYTRTSGNIYYSPSGMLNQISIAGIKRDSNSTLSNQYNLIQLSSTEVLSKGQTEPQTTNTLFMGGITYDYSELTESVADSSYAYLNSEILVNSRGTKTRGESWDSLPGAMQEIETLNKLFNSNNKTNHILSGENANESAFKKLSGSSPKVLHIATHGYFYENIEFKPINSFNLSTEDKYRLAEDPLLRSGLILAGANYSWKYGYNPYEEEEDGILTALEISNMDLSNTDMVVLSACETGLGYIDGNEGVYGLQRAFKMAGVNIIVMSLWKVPDFETAEFMNLFYSNWLVINNVKESFNEAQLTMQTKYSTEPEKWAAFVLFE